MVSMKSQSLFQQMVFCNNEPIPDSEYGICHNPYFSRWFSAIKGEQVIKKTNISHNPYFSRWFSAIYDTDALKGQLEKSQSLFQQMVFCNISQEEAI